MLVSPCSKEFQAISIPSSATSSSKHGPRHRRMYLREVTLRNWRSYRSANFKFGEPKGKKRVVLVGAMNGTGKTSLLMALYLGLFGREAMAFVEGFRRGYTVDERIRSYRRMM